MFDLSLPLESLFEFSRSHCISICAVLVPANLLATSQTLLWLWLPRPWVQVQITAAAAGLYASLLLLHVFTWFAIGIVMAPTFILIFLGSVCIATNLCAVLYGKEWVENLQRQTWVAALSAKFATKSALPQ